ncbi:MAG: barstar family protein [Elusimicrobiota bacterium]|jgi:RNAse (barnase) inhibitor barstar
MKKNAALPARLADSGKPYLLKLEPEDLPAVRKATTDLSFGFWEIDAKALTDEEAVWDLFAKAFAFPAHFGRNWDSLIDCLRDLDGTPFKGYVLVLSGAEALANRDPELLGALIDCLDNVSEEFDQWKGGRVPFKTVLID